MVNMSVFNDRSADTSSVGKAEKRIFSFSGTEDGFSECCAVDIVFYCDRNMEAFLKDFLKLCVRIIRDIAVGINNIPIFRIYRSCGTDANRIERKRLFRKTADSI